MLWERTLIFALRAHIMFIIRLKKNVSDTSYAAIGSFQLNEMMQVHNGHECTVLHASMKCWIDYQWHPSFFTFNIQCYEVAFALIKVITKSIL